MNAEMQLQFKVAIQVLEDYFKTVELGRLVTFEEIAKVAQLDVRQARHVIESVKRILLKHHDRVMVNVRGAGYLVADTGRALAESSGYRKKSFRAAKHAFCITNTISLDGMTDEEKIRVMNEQAKSGILLVAYKAAENKALKGPATLNQPQESDVIRLLLDRSRKD